jgi:hypothetical protein
VWVARGSDPRAFKVEANNTPNKPKHIMNDDRQMVVQFNNGAKLELRFPTQIRNSSGAVLEAMKKIMETDKLLIEAEGRLIVIPWASVKQLEVSPVPATLPFGVIKGAKVVQ